MTILTSTVATYSLTFVAETDLGATQTSATITVNVIGPYTPGAVIANKVAQDSSFLDIYKYRNGDYMNFWTNVVPIVLW